MIDFRFLSSIRFPQCNLSIWICEYFARTDHFSRFHQTLIRMKREKMDDTDECVIFYPDLSIVHLLTDNLYFSPTARNVKISTVKIAAGTVAGILHSFLLKEPDLKLGLRYLRSEGLR